MPNSIKEEKTTTFQNTADEAVFRRVSSIQHRGERSDVKKKKQVEKSLRYKFRQKKYKAQLRHAFEAVDSDDGYLQFYEYTSDVEQVEDECAVFFKFLDTSPRNYKDIEAYFEAKNKAERLQILSRMHIADAVVAVVASNGLGKNRLLNRLDYYRDLLGEISEQIMPHQPPSRETSITHTSVSGIHHTDIATGLLRDTLYAEMLGTPELTAYQSAMHRINREREQAISERIPWDKSTAHLPAFFGPTSNISYSRDTNAEVVHYQQIIDTFAEARERVVKKGHLDESVIEHRAVLLAANWYYKSCEYNVPGRGMGSPYVSGFKEAVAWARLDSGVQKQLKGMRRKIMDIDLHKIDRFIGKSGDNKYGKAYRELHWELGHLPTDQEELNKWAAHKNYEEIETLKEKFISSQERILNRYEHRMAKINALDLPEDERFLQHQAVESDTQKQLKQLALALQAEQEIIQNRDAGQVVSDLRKEEQALKERDEVHKSLAHQALDLHFIFNHGTQYGTGHIDWINKADFGLIKTVHTAIRKGVSHERALAYAIAYTLFKPEQINSDLLSILVNHLDYYPLVYSAKEILEVLSRYEVDYTPTEVIYFARNWSAPHLEKYLKVGYRLSALADFPWLSREDPIRELFPYDRSKGAQEAWCVKHAFSLPEGWRRKSLGSLILNRLQNGLDASLHDATFWLSEFEVPVERDGVVFRDLQCEYAFLYAACLTTEENQFRLPTNPKKYLDLFSRPEHIKIYEAIITELQSGPVSSQRFTHIIERIIETQDSEKSSLGDAYSENNAQHILEASEAIQKLFFTQTESLKIPELVAKLRNMSTARKNGTEEAFSWFSRHSSTPHTLLTFAWNNRHMALKENCPDNPKAIKQWADLNALRSAYKAMEMAGRLPKNLTYNDIVEMGDWARELVRCYDGERTLLELSFIKDSLSSAIHITPEKIILGNGWHGEILRRDDPRGTTIGVDTGCCMTLTGASSSCIRAGYTLPSYGFFALYKDNTLVAQSFLYTNLNQDPSILIADNIEASAGRDLDKVIGYYRSFFAQYLRNQLIRGYGSLFTKVHVGTGYSDVGLGDMPHVTSIRMPDTRIYTDADSQRLLYSMSIENVQQATEYSAQLLEPHNLDSNTTIVIEQLMEQYFDLGKGWDREKLIQELTNPENIVVCIKSGDEVVGFSIAVPSTFEEQKTLHIAATVIHPDHQRKGLVSHLMYLLEQEARKRNYSVVTRNATIANGYADKIEKNYVVLAKKDINGPSGTQRFLAVSIPEHPESTLRKKHAVETEQIVEILRPMSEDDLPLLVQLESECYPANMRQGEESFREAFDRLAQLREATGRNDLNFSYLASINGRPIGYILIAPEISDVKDGEIVAHIYDIAVLPKFRRSNYAKKLLTTALDTIDQYRIDVKNAEDSSISFPGSLEMEARESTSFRILMSPAYKDWLEHRGYVLTHQRKLAEYLDDEDFYFLRYEHRS